MKNDDSEQRIYVGDCGCVRIESKHFRATLQPEQFVEILREIIANERRTPPFCNRLTISNNVSSSGFVSIENRRKKRYL
jgi:hypothetical protein